MDCGKMESERGRKERREGLDKGSSNLILSPPPPPPPPPPPLTIHIDKSCHKKI